MEWARRAARRLFRLLYGVQVAGLEHCGQAGPRALLEKQRPDAPEAA
jgi:hypothetical protein